jgi:hypothetical protein
VVSMPMRFDAIHTALIASEKMQGMINVSRLDFGIRSLFILEITVSLFRYVVIEQRKGLVVFYFSASFVP